jgi:hypothetical protein
LDTVNVPDGWMADLRTKLLKLEESEWAAVIAAEEAKAKSAGHKTEVRGAGQQVQPTLIVESTKPKTPDWSKIMSSPQAFAEFQRQFQEQN